jgi:hypothetical protein
MEHCVAPKGLMNVTAQAVAGVGVRAAKTTTTKIIAG